MTATYTNTENHPTYIDDSAYSKKKNRPPKDATAHHIKLSHTTGIPLGVLKGKNITYTEGKSITKKFAKATAKELHEDSSLTDKSNREEGQIEDNDSDEDEDGER